jgi:hypothetical protein
LPARGRRVTIYALQGRQLRRPQWEEGMNLSAPTIPVFWISAALAILALAGHFTKIDFVSTYQFWLAIVAYVVLLIGCVFKGL